MLHEKTVLVEVPEVSLSLDGRLCSGGGGGGVKTGRGI